MVNTEIDFSSTKKLVILNVSKFGYQVPIKQN